MDEVKAITLRNIDISEIGLDEQFSKMKEEDHEFEMAVLEALVDRSPEHDRHAIEEFWDKVQSSLSYMQKTLGINAQEVMDHYYLHEEKLKSRPRKKE